MEKKDLLTKHEIKMLDKLSAVDISEVSSTALACWLARMLLDRGISCISVMHLPNNQKNTDLYTVVGNVPPEGDRNQVAAGLLASLLECLCGSGEIDRRALIESLLAGLPDGS